MQYSRKKSIWDLTKKFAGTSMVSPTQGSSSWGRSSLRHKILSNFEFRLRTCIIKEYAKLRFFWHKQNNKWGKTCSRRETIIQTVSIFQIRAAFLNYSVQKSLTQDFFLKIPFQFFRQLTKSQEWGRGRPRDQDSGRCSQSRRKSPWRKSCNKKKDCNVYHKIPACKKGSRITLNRAWYLSAPI